VYNAADLEAIRRVVYHQPVALVNNEQNVGDRVRGLKNEGLGTPARHLRARNRPPPRSRGAAMNRESVARTPQARRPSSHDGRLLDDAAAEEVHRLADKLAQDLDALKLAIDLVNTSTIEEPRHNRKRARRVLVGVWGDLAGIARALSEPPPKFHADRGNPMPCPRRRRFYRIGEIKLRRRIYAFLRRPIFPVLRYSFTSCKMS
jgi:hypothetical protein